MLSPDSEVLVLLCSQLSLEKDSGISPLTLREWNPLARKIQASKISRPGGLLDLSNAEIKNQLELTEKEADRLAILLARRKKLDFEITRLTSKGIRVTTRADSNYPERYRQRLKESAPVVLFYAGELALLGQPGIAVVGSRHLDDAGRECAEFVGNACGLSGLVLYSGGAKGVDTISMDAALQARGTAVGILANSLEQSIRDPQTHLILDRGDLCLATPYSPDAGFSVGAAMGRNRLIYCLADFAIVVVSDVEKGGTWAGAIEALKSGWIPVFVLEHPAMPEGNRLLIQKGVVPFPHPFTEHYSKLHEWLLKHGFPLKPKATQLDMF